LLSPPDKAALVLCPNDPAQLPGGSGTCSAESEHVAAGSRRVVGPSMLAPI
jgi:hypothetical protein